jgi:hypothetical protein
MRTLLTCALIALFALVLGLAMRGEGGIIIQSPAAAGGAKTCAGDLSGYDYCEDFESGEWCCLPTATSSCPVGGTVDPNNDDGGCQAPPYDGGPWVEAKMDTATDDAVRFDNETARSQGWIHLARVGNAFREGGIGLDTTLGNNDEHQIAACVEITTEGLADGEECGILGTFNPTAEWQHGIYLTQDPNSRLRFAANPPGAYCDLAEVSLNTVYELNLVLDTYNHANGDHTVYINGAVQNACSDTDTDITPGAMVGLSNGDGPTANSCGGGANAYRASLLLIEHTDDSGTRIDLDCDLIP